MATILDRLEALAERADRWRTGAPAPSRMTAPRPELQPRPLADDDVTAFMVASGEAAEVIRRKQEAETPCLIAPKQGADFIKWVGDRNPRRLRRLGSDLDWLRREARRFGISPEEIRWLL